MVSQLDGWMDELVLVLDSVVVSQMYGWISINLR